MKLGILCNNGVALPAVKHLLGLDDVELYIGVDASNTTFIDELADLRHSVRAALTHFTREGFEGQLCRWLNDTKPLVVLMMTCPFKIPVAALTMTPFGFINFHYGLLPQYQGANPVFEQIRRRESFGGITVHHADERIDTGAIIMQRKISIGAGDTFGIHIKHLASLGVEMLTELLALFRSGEALPAAPQDENLARYFKRPGHKDVTVVWNSMPAADIVALVNACTPWNFGAATVLDGNVIGISQCSLSARVPVPGTGRPGQIMHIDQEHGLTVLTCDQKALELHAIYLNGTFVPGYSLLQFGISPGCRFQ